MKTFPSTCVFLLIVIVMVQSAPTPRTPPPPPAIPHSKLAFQWPITLCSDGDCLKEKLPPPEVFKLHGLWPMNNNWTSPITNCSGDNFTANPIDDIRTSLLLYWPSYREPENKFWKHEWDVHGTCSNLPLRQFFDRGLELAKLHASTLVPALVNSKIRPGYNTSTPAGIRDAIVKGIGVKCQLKCVKHTEQLYWLQEIHLCLDQNFNLQNCPDQGWLDYCGRYPNHNTTRLAIPIN